MKKIILFLLLLPALGALAASQDARTLRKLQEKAGSETLVPVDASPQQMAAALADVAEAAGKPQSNLSDWNSKDYDALFALLQQYREELAALGLKQAAVDTAMEALKKRIADLEERMEYLPPDGMKIHGSFSVLADDFLVTGPGQYSGKPSRFRHFKQDVALDFTAVNGPFLGITEVELVNYVGSYAAPEPLGVTRVYAEIRTPIAIQTGDFGVRMTPLTLWRHEDDDPYIPEPYKGKVDRLRKMLHLEDDNRQYLSGIRLLTDMMLTDDFALETEGYFSVMKRAGNANFVTADPVSGVDLDKLNTVYDTYLGTWKLAVEPVKGIRVSYTGIKIWDDPDSAGTNYDTTQLPAAYQNLTQVPVAGFDNMVHSANLDANVFDGFLRVEAEYAISGYRNPNVGVTLGGVSTTPGAATYLGNTAFREGGYLPGTALVAKVSVGPKWMTLSGSMRQVDESFISPGAQSRSSDRQRNVYGPFATDNSQFNPQTNSFGQFSFYSSPVTYPGTQFNRRLLAPSTVLDSTKQFNFNYLVPADMGFEAGSPYGLATPNRQGFGGELAFDLWKGSFKPDFKVDLSSQIVGEGSNFMPGMGGEKRPLETYTMAWGGMVVDLNPVFKWPFRFTVGYRMEDSRATAPWAPQAVIGSTLVPAAQVAFDSTRLDLGLEYYPTPNLGLFVGHRHLDYNGTIYNPDSTVYGARGQFGVQQDYETTGEGLRYFMGDRIVIDLCYTNQIFPSRDAALTNGVNVAYQMEQIFAKLTASF